MAILLTKGWSETFCPILAAGEYSWDNNREYGTGYAFVFSVDGSMLRSFPGDLWQPTANVLVTSYDEYTGDGTASLSFQPIYEEYMETDFLIGIEVTIDTGEVITTTSDVFAYGGQSFSFTGDIPPPAFVTNIENMDPV